MSLAARTALGISRVRRVAALQIACLCLAGVFISGCGEKAISEQEYLSQAGQFEKKNEIFSGIIVLKNLLQSHPDSIQARTMLGKFYLRMADGENAEKEFRYALKLAGESKNTLRLLLAQALVIQNKPSQALTELSLISAGTEQVKMDMLGLKIQAYLLQDDLTAAADLIQKSKHYKTPGKLILLAQAKYFMVSGNLTLADITLSDLLKLDKQSSEAWLLKGRIAEIKQDLAGAEFAYLSAHDLEPPGRMTRRKSQAHVSLAYIYLSQNKLEKASEQILQIYKTDKKSYVTNFLQGLLAYQRQDYKTATQFFLTAYNNNQEHLQSVLLLGASNYALGHYNQAEHYLSNYLVANPSNVYASRMLGNTYLKLGENDKAVEIYKRTLSYNPDNAELLSIIGELAIRTGDISSGANYLTKARQAAGDKTAFASQMATAHLAKAEFNSAIQELESIKPASQDSEFSRTYKLIFAYLGNNQPAQALAVARQYTKKYPDDPSGYNLLGAIYSVLQQKSKARENYSKSLGLDSKNIPALLNLARLDISERDTKRADQRLDTVLAQDNKLVSAMLLKAQVAEARHNPSDALVWLKKAESSSADPTQIRFLLYQFHTRQKQYQKAQTYLSEILSSDPNNLLASALQVDTYLRQGKPDLALQSATALTKTDSPTPVGFFKLGQVYLVRNEYELAKASFQQALKTEPNFLPAIRSLAFLELRQGSLEDALRYVANAKKQRQNSGLGDELEGDILNAVKRYSSASQAYSRAASTVPSSALFRKFALAQHWAGTDLATIQAKMAPWLAEHPGDSELLLTLADIAALKNDVAMAEKGYRRVLSLVPDHAQALNNLAWVLYQSGGSKQEALEMAKRANALQPDDPAGMDTYGWILVNEGKLKAGMNLLEKAHQQLPNNPDVAYHYAFALAGTGQRREARQLLQSTVDNYPEFSSRSEANKLLQRLR